jgi:hypothetical protein
MPSYHPDAEADMRSILAGGGREVKRCLGMMIRRHLGIEDGSEPLTAGEWLPASGPNLTRLYEVDYLCGLLARVTVVYEADGTGAKVLALDAFQGLARVGHPKPAPDARARAWARAS